MRKNFLWAALLVIPLAVAGLAYGLTLAGRPAEQLEQPRVDGYTCPLTGEELPCPLCCPLNDGK